MIKAILFAILCMCISCSKDDNATQPQTSSSSIIGIWKSSYFDISTYPPNGAYMRFTFKSDSLEVSKVKPTSTMSVSGPYTIRADTIFCIGKANNTTMDIRYIYSIVQSSIVVTSISTDAQTLIDDAANGTTVLQMQKQ